LGIGFNFGERTYGERYAQAVEATGYNLDTLRKFQWVTDQIPAERRIERLEFGHHDAVAALPPAEADKILKKAEASLKTASPWTVTDTRRAARKSKGEPENVETKSSECPFCQADLSEWLEKR
jgi:hypothetical protein